MIGQIPVVKFKEKKFQGLLSYRLFHKCLDIACEDLKACSVVPETFPDAFGELRLWRTFLAAYVGDLPELWVAVATAHSESPYSLAAIAEFGDAKPKAARTGEYILGLLDDLKARYDPLDLNTFELQAKEVGLNGVHEPFWRDWEYADPSQFLTIDILHGVKKFVGDHPVKWMTKLVGKEEIDNRYAALQRAVGRRHFDDGFTKYKKRTHGEQADILRHLVAVSQDAPKVHRGIMKAIRALADFFYVAQYEYHDEETLQYLKDFLKTFHEYKGAFITANARKNFKIPKLECFLHFPNKIRFLGSLNQYSAETTERLHIPSAKEPYRHTNRKEFELQMCRFLDREERVALFWTQLQWRDLLDGVDLHLKDNLDSDEDPDPEDLENEKQAAMQELSTIVLPKPMPNFFTRKKAITNETTAFRVTVRAHWRNMTVNEVSTKFHLPDLENTLKEYVSNATFFVEDVGLSTAVDVWKNVRLQQRTVQDDKVPTSPQTVSAVPPSEISPLGFCNFVLFKQRNDSPYVGISKLKVPSSKLGSNFWSPFQGAVVTKAFLIRLLS